MKSIILILVIGVAATYGQIYRSSYAPAGSMYPRPQSAYEEEEAIADRTKGGDESSNVPIEDVNLRNQVQSWPKEKQPFWYLNSQAINKQIGKVNGAAAAVPSTTADSTVPTPTSQAKPLRN